VTPAGTTAPARAAGLCPRCLAPFDVDQEYCLECGLRLPWENPVFAKLTAKASGRSLRWVPRDWVWPALIALVVAAGGAAAAIAVSRDDGPQAARVSTAIGGNPLAPATVPALSPAGTSGASGGTPTTPARAARGLVAWPLGKNGWTIVLISLDQAGGLAAARDKAQEALGHGLPNVGIIDSSRFPSLHPGYYVVFSGVYPTNAAAQDAVGKAKDAGYQAYIRPITQ